MFIYVIAYLASFIVFIALDGAWLAAAGPRLYKPKLGPLLAEKPRLAPAALFYLLYMAGIVWFAVTPSVDRGWPFAFLNGALLGLLAYGTYDLTCATTMKTWSIKVTIADMVWGAVATGVASAAGVVAARHFSG
jgi:uncharacterized membrane protein